MREKKRLREISDLSKMIFDVILKDKKICEKLALLVKKEVITKETVVFFFLGGDIKNELFGSIKMVERNQKKLSNPTKQQEKDDTRKVINASEQIDGSKLTPNECIFQEMVVDEFDEEEWLKKIGLAW